MSTARTLVRVKRLPAWVTYTVLRLLLIAVPLVVLLIIVPFQYWLFSVIAAVLIGFCLSYLLLHKQRAAMSSAIYARRLKPVETPTPDDLLEDGIVDANAPGTVRVDSDGAVANAIQAGAGTRVEAPADASGTPTQGDAPTASVPAGSEPERGAEDRAVHQGGNAGQL